MMITNQTQQAQGATMAALYIDETCNYSQDGGTYTLESFEAMLRECWPEMTDDEVDAALNSLTPIA